MVQAAVPRPTSLALRGGHGTGPGHVGIDGTVTAQELPDFDIWPISRQLVDKYIVAAQREAFFANMRTEHRLLFELTADVSRQSTCASTGESVAIGTSSGAGQPATTPSGRHRPRPPVTDRVAQRRGRSNGRRRRGGGFLHMHAVATAELAKAPDGRVDAVPSQVLVALTDHPEGSLRPFGSPDGAGRSRAELRTRSTKG